MMAMWHENQARLKTDKVVVKLREDNGRFMQSIIIPTIMYPLNGPYQVFHAGNTSRAGENMYVAIDRVKYKIGHCYTNTKEVVAELQKAGFDAVSYAGWLFTGGNQTPIHHCWAVVNGDVVVDLADDFAMQKVVQPDIENLHGLELMQAFADFVRNSQDWMNSVRCYPIGQPIPTFYYVGCPCEPEEAVQIWHKLIKAFPNHECCRNCDDNSMSETQRFLYNQGLMQ